MWAIGQSKLKPQARGYTGGRRRGEGGGIPEDRAVEEGGSIEDDLLIYLGVSYMVSCLSFSLLARIQVELDAPFSTFDV